ncbi:hypothetical protein HJG60_009954 [Phyllostomus discolor]|uniref:Uncharacterized protein n=1 Tax=Phyllostomus discolor TaxID=89673 RepID=A0A834B8N0_9CHIR|nr:hypothetical protein HJG60_009954 [Phyllostomus discolor]
MERSRGEAGGAPVWRERRREAGGVAEREAGRADAAGEVLGRKGRGSARARNAEAAAAAAVAAALQLAPRSGLRRRAGERVSVSGQILSRTTPGTRARRRHRIHPGAAQAPRAEQWWTFSEKSFQACLDLLSTSVFLSRKSGH